MSERVDPRDRDTRPTPPAGQDPDPETVERVRTALHDRLDRNYGDTAVFSASQLDAAVPATPRMIGAALARLADGDAPAGALDVSRWSVKPTSGQTRWQVRRDAATDGGGVECPVCGAFSETCYRCDNCGKDLADTDSQTEGTDRKPPAASDDGGNS